MKQKKTTIVGLACGAVCALCVFGYVQSVRNSFEAERAEALARYGGEQIEVCVAKRDVAVGEVLDAGSVQTKLWLADLLPDGAFRFADDVVGRKASSMVLAGEVLTERRFEGQAAELSVPDGLTAVSVPAKDVQTVGGAVAPGSRVDVYATGGAGTVLLAPDVTVLATNAGAGPAGSEGSLSWLTLGLAPEAVHEVVAAAQGMELYFTLPGEGAHSAPSRSGPTDEAGKTSGSGTAAAGGSKNPSASAVSDGSPGKPAAGDAASTTEDSNEEGEVRDDDAERGAVHG